MNNNTHPCANKCSEFKDGGQCFYCLINETVNRGVYSMHRTEHRIDLIVEPNDMGDDEHIENHISPNCNCSEMHSVCINLHRSRDIAYKEVERTEKHIQLAETELYRQQQEVERLKTENLAMQAEIDDLQKRVDLLEGKIKEALNTVYAMKGKADCDHLTDKEQSFVYGFGYELHEILKEEQALKAGEV